ncbi:hemerythrin family protein [Sporomusa sp.]|uniref:bacteriohemerythrin n=1 Tax=Sporomusa sp. TaxID=2078658 RepID=UPI002C2E7AEA|nr:hemerythrin family protein [Sporomusa sp.]HWR45082.1 hemerythrin family protein [Sporomusa sp.]
MVLWKDVYELGIPAIDEQHKKLFEIANEIDELLNNKLITDKYDRIVAIIDELRDYTTEHFEAEEAYMFATKYPKFLSHKAMHHDFIDKMSSIDYEQIDNEQNAYLKEILKFVIEWLVDHILKEDKLISRNSL